MGAFGNDTQRHLFLWCTITICFLLIADYSSYQVSAESKVDSDLVFDVLDQTKTHGQHHRIARKSSLTSSSTHEDNQNLAQSSPPVQEQHWLKSAVDRVKRSIGRFFSTTDDHKNAYQRRKHRSPQDENDLGQQEAQEDYTDEEDEDDVDQNEEYEQSSNNHVLDNDNAYNGTIEVGSNHIGEDDEDFTEGSGSGETITTTTITDSNNPVYFRFTFTLVEPYVPEFSDRNSNKFRDLASRIRRSVEELYDDVPGTQTASVINIEKHKSDPFKIRVTLDLDSNQYSNREEVISKLSTNIEDNHRIGSFTASPEEFYSRVFEAPLLKCNDNEIPCRNTSQCIPMDARCNSINDCDDGSDEDGCDAPVIEDSGSGDGEIRGPEGGRPLENKCRADDVVRCSDGSRTICADQECDGTKDCDDGGDERNCPTNINDCATGEFICDVSRCLPINKRCDGTTDCTDATDEIECPAKCYGDEILCDGSKCVPANQRCDGVAQCTDGTDESNCPGSCQPGEFRCDNDVCIPEYLRCNGRNECPSGQDEQGCPACTDDQFNCGDSCININFQCDGFKDCADGRDERDCSEQCNNDQFACSSGTCIPLSQQCDRRQDCDDGSDEFDCPEPKRCRQDEYSCRDGTCIPNYEYCNGRPECPDGSDESECPCRGDQFQCLNGRCIDNYLRCNRRNDCSDGSDEHNCPTERPPYVPEPTYEPARCPYGQQACQSGNQCILRSQLCDGRADCNDLSDESNCPGSSDGLNLRTYPSSQEIKENREVVFQCRDEGPLRARVHWIRGNGDPLPSGSRDINGRLEIPNIKVEHSGAYICEAVGYPPSTPGAQVSVQLQVSRWAPPPTRPPTACGLQEATCSNGDCIPKNLVCDGRYDCTDGSDESRCNPNGCEPNEYRCANKKCVLKTWRCDSDDDCGDGSDESNCQLSPPGSICQYSQFTCHSNNQCIPRSYHCDMAPDCVDGSDEIGCSQPVISKAPPPMINLNVGEIFEITCTAVGVPVPEIVWRLNWGHIPNKCRTTSDNGFGTLTCNDIQVEDQGAYSCEAINIKGAVFAVPDTILIVKQHSVCPAGYFNTEARSEAECIKCFCFGHTTSCRSADLFIFHFQPPFDTLKLLGARVDPRTGVVEIRDEPIYRGSQPQLTGLGRNGVHSMVPSGGELGQPDLVPYFALPENYHGNQLKSYGGYLRYNIHHTNRGYQRTGPDVILSGNGYTLLHQARNSPSPNTNEHMEVRFFEGEWLRRSETAPETPATREEIMMALADVNNILIKLQYNEGSLNTTLTDIEMDSAAVRNSGLGGASYVEECTCPVGYTGDSCERCADGYVRHRQGPWLGQCYKEPQTCPAGTYNDGRDCQTCPCPLTNPGNQFARTCSRHPDGDVVCDCPPGYVGRRCDQCATGYTGNPLIPGDSCRPTEYCSAEGSLGTDSSGRCRCKDLTDGPTCNQCKANTFYLSRENQFGCIACFCMGVSQQCSSSNWYRDQILTYFTSSSNEFKLVDPSEQEPDLTTGIRLDSINREIAYSNFPVSNVYYWSLPSRYLGNKITSYGGFLRYTLKNTPVPGGQSSRNSAADVELVSKNNIRLLYFAREQTQASNTPQTFAVPLLEQYWQRQDGQKADREHILMALADLEAIYIKATYFTNTREASLSSVSLDIASERNTGSSERALEVEQCHCPTGYKGLSCEDCDFGYTRSLDGIYLGLCQPCSCNGHSSECDPETGECSNCRDYTTGESCEMCLPGYQGDPANGIPCQYQGNPTPCNCDPRGSISNDCYNGVCSCRTNVEGANCDRCRPGTFGLNASNADGCEQCFCSGVASECSESNWYIEQIPYQIIDNSDFSLTDQYHRTRITDRLEVTPAMNEISYNFLPSNSERMFWSLPSTFTGNQIRSYGGRLEFIQRYTQRPNARYVPDQDVILTGNGVTIYWSNPLEQPADIANRVSVPLHPNGNWYRSDQNKGPRPASREDILTVLANVESILVRATQSTDTASAYLSDITLDTTVEQYTGQSRSTNVEICRCPEGYRGSSCESCAHGYYRDLYYDDNTPLGSCKRCPCNNNEESCSVGSDRRVVCNCLPGYTGRACDSTGVPTPSPRPRPPNPPEPSPPSIEVLIVTPSIEIYEVGSTVRFNCTARSRLAPRTVRVMWSKDGGDLPQYAVDDGRGLLVITNLRVADSGRYICEADDGYSIVTSSVTLNVGDLRQEPPRMAISPPYVDVHEGQQVEVRCASSGTPTPNLRLIRLDSQPLNPSHYFENGVFRIPQVSRTDAGQYQCIATNNVGTDTGTFQLDVRETIAPIMRVEIQPAYYTGNTDDTVTFRCRGDGNVESIRWTKENGQLPYNSREDNGVLIINRARPEDSGVYICTVTSYSGTRGSQRATVSISGSDAGRYPTAVVTPERTTINQGSSIELHCAATGTPIPSVKWTKLGTELGTNTEQVGSVLHIRNARMEDRGVYVCVSSNMHGLGQASAIVDVTRLESPVLEIHPSERQTVVAGSSAILQCRAISGIPSPTISWTRGLGLPMSQNIEQMSGGTLRFTQITTNEEGEYICTAVNEAGRSTAIANIIVHTTPEVYITPSEDIITRSVNDFLRLECHGSGVPQPSVVWSKYGRAQPDSVSFGTGPTMAVHEINRLSKEDEGLYICKGQNSAGVVERRVQLVVDTLPERGDITGFRSRSRGEDATSGSGYKHNEQRPQSPNTPKEIDEYFTASVGSRAELRCRINDDTNRIYVNWIRADNSSLPPDAFISSGTLYIDNVQASAAGVYRCLGTDQTTGQVVFSVNSHLEVISPPRITLIPPKQVVHPGDNAYIQCSATGEQPIRIMWSPVSRSMPSSVYTRDGLIQFNNIKLQDAGTYRCTAINNAGEADAVADVSVEENIHKPVVTAENHDQSAPLGSSVTLRCRTRNAVPERNIRWFRERLPLSANSTVNGEFLHIHYVTHQDEGRYYCEIPTPGGTSSDYVDLHVLNPSGSPSPYLQISPPERERQSGEHLDIVCQSNEPGVITTWSKLSGWLGDNARDVGGTLRINSLRLDNAGVYRCEATGHNGVYHKDYELRVAEPPQARDETPIKVQTAARGATVLLDCNTNLEEPVSYVWTKQNGQLPRYIDTTSKSITLNNIGSNDAGTYICSANNGRRNVDEPIILVVTGIVPYFTQAPNSFLALQSLGHNVHVYIQFNFEISFKPENGHGLILYNGNKGNDRTGDFISLALVNSVPEFRYNLGHSTTIVRGDQPISSREWHTVKINRNRKKVSMYVDGQGPFVGNAEGKYIGLDLIEQLYLGGVPDYQQISPEVNVNSGFVGCISRFKIGHSHQDILHDAVIKKGVTTCETCSENKCENQGACQEALSKEGYTCICPSGYGGPTCSKLKGEACSPYACGNGRCIDTANSFECQCPLGRSGRRCEREITINEPAFQNDAYFAYPTPKPTRHLKVTLKIKPKDVSDGVLLYCSETDEGHGEFVSLAIKDRHLEFRFDAGNGATVITHNEELLPDRWTVLTASRSLSDGRLMVNGGSPVLGRLAGNHKALNLQTPLYVGGFDKHRVKINDQVQVFNGFNGCISDISISGLDLNLITNVTEASNVQDCSAEEDVDNNIVSYANEVPKPIPYDSRKTGCSSSPCQNNGHCYPLSPMEYTCTCTSGFIGKNCENIYDPCEEGRCQNGGTCKVNGTRFICDCPMGYTGLNCEQRTELRNDANFNGNSFLEFDRSLLTHEDDEEDEIIAFEISTNSSDGLIFWHGQGPNEDGQGFDYISLSIQNGYLEYSYDLGSGPAIIQNHKIRVDDGQRHSIILKRLGKEGSIEIDNNYYQAGEADGITTTMNCAGNLYLGGTPNTSLMTGGRFIQGFNGCIHGFEVQNSKTLDLGAKAINGLNVKPCSSPGRAWSQNAGGELVN